MFLTRRTQYFVQLAQTEMRLRIELKQRSYQLLNRLTDYELQFRGVHVQWRYYEPSLFFSNCLHANHASVIHFSH